RFAAPPLRERSPMTRRLRAPPRELGTADVSRVCAFSSACCSCFPPLVARLSRQHHVALGLKAAGLAVQVDALEVAWRAREGLPAFVLDLHDDRAEAA